MWHRNLFFMKIIFNIWLVWGWCTYSIYVYRLFKFPTVPIQSHVIHLCCYSSYIRHLLGAFSFVKTVNFEEVSWHTIIGLATAPLKFFGFSDITINTPLRIPKIHNAMQTLFWWKNVFMGKRCVWVGVSHGYVCNQWWCKSSLKKVYIFYGCLSI